MLSAEHNWSGIHFLNASSAQKSRRLQLFTHMGVYVGAVVDLPTWHRFACYINNNYGR
jgi:hypothetical protein